MLLLHDEKGEIEKSPADFPSTKKIANKLGAYALAAGFTVGNSYMALSGDLSGSEQILYQAEALIGSASIPFEYKTDFISEEIVGDITEKFNFF